MFLKVLNSLLPHRALEVCENPSRLALGGGGINVDAGGGRPDQ
jgi:hypothetical protein